MPHRKLKGFLGAMANDNRFGILLALKQKPLNVGELCEVLNLEQSCVSHSLQRLVAEKLISSTADGAFRIYSIRSEPVSSFLDELLEFCDVLAAEEASAMSAERAKREVIAATLRERETELSGILDHAPITLSVIDRTGTYLTIVGEMVRHFGKPVEDLIGKNVFDLYPRQTLVGDNMARAVAGEEVRWTLESAGFTYEHFSLPIRNEAGEVERVLTITLNATEWLRVKKPGIKLPDFQYLVEEVPGLRVLVDRNATITWINHFGLQAAPQASVGTNFFAAFPSAKAQGLEQELRDALNSGDREEYILSLPEIGTGETRYRLRIAPVWQHSHVYAVAMFFLPMS